jgi:hypothetical protein
MPGPRRRGGCHRWSCATALGARAGPPDARPGDEGVRRLAVRCSASRVMWDSLRGPNFDRSPGGDCRHGRRRLVARNGALSCAQRASLSDVTIWALAARGRQAILMRAPTRASRRVLRRTQPATQPLAPRRVSTNPKRPFRMWTWVRGRPPCAGEHRTGPCAFVAPGAGRSGRRPAWRRRTRGPRCVLGTFNIGVALSVAYVLAFVAAGVIVWLRRPDYRTGRIMVLAGTSPASAPCSEFPRAARSSRSARR